jgi:ABC-2 type transport system permease protein
MRYYLKLFTTLLRINIQQELAYRTDALVNIFVMLAWTGWDLLSITIVFSNTATLGGWDFGALLALLGVFRLVHTLMGALVWPNTEKFNTAMRDGTLDYTLLQPASTLFLVSFTRIIIWRGADLVLAVVLIVVGLSLSGAAVTLPAFISFAVLMAGGIAIFYALWIVLMGITFWFIKFDNNVTILQALIEAGRYPATVYPPWLRMIVSFIVPIALATTVPVQALRGELAWWQVAGFLAVTVVVVAVALRIWQAGVRRYSGASA